MFRLGVIVSYGGNVLRTFADAAEELGKEGYEIEVRGVAKDSEVDWQGLFTWLRKADAAFIHASPYWEKYEEFLASLEENSHPHPTLSHQGRGNNFLDSHPPPSRERNNKVVISIGEGAKGNSVGWQDIAQAERYYKSGGKKNLMNLILFLGKLAGYPFEADEPEEIPWFGIYHPDLGVFENANQYQKKYPLKPRVGILFYRSAWINRDTLAVDAILRELENRGIGVLPVFSYGFGDSRLNIPGNEVVLSLFKGVEIILNLQSFSLTPRAIVDNGGKPPLTEIGVPALQLVKEYYKSEDEWREDSQGIGPMTQIMNIAQPEFDGFIEPILISAKAEAVEPRANSDYQVQSPIKERIRFLADRVESWLKLKEIPKEKRRVTFVLHNAPCKSVEATVGKGDGLDTLESLVRIMRELKEAGYDVKDIPENGKALIDLILSRKAISEFRWTTTDEIVRKGGVLEFIGLEKYKTWFDELPQRAREKTLEGWGEPPGEGMVLDGKILVTGIKLGNVNVIVQPKRGCYGAKCDGKVCKVLHDPNIPPPHNWLATYKWIQENSDIVVHVGTHGYLEFLPGKGVGLSDECFPEISIGNKPHFYIYTVKNPMEGVIAKRRSYATLVDHSIPVMSPSGLYDELDNLEELLRQFENAKSLGEEGRVKILKDEIIKTAEDANLIIAAGMPLLQIEDFDRYVDFLHDKLNLLRETVIRDGLHILSQPPEGDALIDMLVSILRFDGAKPSIRRKILEIQGFDYDEVVENPSYKWNGKTNGEVLNESTDIAVKLMKCALRREGGNSPSPNNPLPSRERVYNPPSPCGRELEGGGEVHPDLSIQERGILYNIVRQTIVEVKVEDKIPELLEVIDYGLSLVPRIKSIEREIPQLLRGFDKEFIEPGPSGNLTRGKIDVLPTGRNFYAIDPWKMPTRAAWGVGEKLTDELLEKFLHEEGKFPESLGMVLFSTDVYRTDGEELCQILYLMGVKPRWDVDGKVRGIEIIPLKDLGRPRIDSTIRLSGIFRDTLPNITSFLDEAIQQVIDLDEPPEMNYLKKHTLEMEGKIGEKARYRIFSAPPGAYGAGVNLAIEASAWKDESDLRDIYINWGGYAYGKDIFGEKAHQSLALNLKNVEVSFNKLESDESDALDCCCFFGYQGGLTAAAKSLSGKEVKTYWGDTRDPNRPAVRDMKDEMERIVRTRLLNPKWLEGKKRHGYRGASDISSRVLHVYGWDATAGVVEDWIYDEIHKRIVVEMREWFMENNPYALEEIARRLLEANERGLWQASQQNLEELHGVYLNLEGLLEDEEREGEFQGGAIEIFTQKDVPEWAEKAKEIEDWKEIVK